MNIELKQDISKRKRVFLAPNGQTYNTPDEYFLGGNLGGDRRPDQMAARTEAEEKESKI